MKVSARNQFSGTITRVETGTVNAEVELSLGGEDRLVAVVTMDSLRELGLAPGRAVIALVKAPMVMLAAAASTAGTLSARNGLRCRVQAVSDTSVNVEVQLALAGGAQLLAVVTREAAAELGLLPGAEVTAIIKASSVVLGVPL